MRPKPMVKIGGRPILWYIMLHFDHYGFNEFAVALGYKGELIRRYFSEYHSSGRSMRVHLGTGVMDYIEGDETQWEREPMETLAAKGEMMAYRHEGFWQPMDTLRDKVRLQELWDSGDPPWRVWD